MDRLINSGSIVAATLEKTFQISETKCELKNIEKPGADLDF